jgi:hypothetical protein
MKGFLQAEHKGEPGYLPRDRKTERAVAAEAAQRKRRK